MERHGAEGGGKSEAGSKGEGKGALCATCRPALAAAPAVCRQRQAEEAAPGIVGDELGETLPPKCWQESADTYSTRLKASAAWIHANYDVAGLCRELPDRLAELDRRKGDRLAK